MFINIAKLKKLNFIDHVLNLLNENLLKICAKLKYY